MLNLAALAMRGPRQASAVLMVSGLLALLFFPAIGIGGVVVALLAMQLGFVRVFGPLVVAAAVVSAVVAVLIGPAAGLTFLQMIVLVWLPLVFFGAIIRQWGALWVGMQGLIVTGLVVTGSYYLFLTDATAWWAETLLAAFQVYSSEAAGNSGWLSEVNLLQLSQDLAPWMPGSVGVTVVLVSAACVLVGRWWQSKLFRPGAFAEEFRALTLGRSFAGLTALLAGAGMIGYLPFANMAIVAMVGLAFQGLAVAHSLIAVHYPKNGWLLGFYGLVLLWPQIAVVVLGCVGIADNWLSFRGARKVGH